MGTIASAPRASEGGHWYKRDGAPCYEIPAKSRPGMRPVDLRDARALGLVPSVSAILAMEAKPQLTAWMVEQGILAAITLPRKAGENDDDFAKRAAVDSREQARKARDRGTHIHAVLQGHFEGQPYGAEDAPYVAPVVRWLQQRYGLNDWHAERSFAHASGYGGKSDLVSGTRGAVIDFKVKDFGEEKEVRHLAYPEHCTQLAAYGRGFGFSKPDGVNVFISSRVPGLIRVREWDNAELATGLRAFDLLLGLWKIRKGFDSSFTEGEIAA